MDTRTRLLQAAEQLLDASPTRDISTRDVCRAAGVGPPVLYRQFGDKNGLLRAVVDYGFDRYLATKRRAEPSIDPVQDLRDGWDTHVEFALAHPAVYRLMFSPSFAQVPAAADEALRILREVVERCAAAGVLTAGADLASEAIMAANIGIALSLVTQPETYRDPTLSRRVRDAVHRDLLTEDALNFPRHPTAALAPAAHQLTALLNTCPHPPLTDAESTLLQQWLRALAGDAPLGPERR